jgi:hypothetical protein
MRYKIVQLEDDKRKTYVHADHPMTDYTLCGLALEGMGRDSNDEHAMAEETKSKITCDSCINLIRHCKAIKL